MKSKLFVISYRNLWRNKRRTLITVSSVFFGVILASLMGSMQQGSYNKMIENVVNYYSGYIQIFDRNYWDDKTINNSFIPSSELMNEINKCRSIDGVIPRLESFALVSSGELTKGVMVIGIDPQKEAEFFELQNKIIKGEYYKQSNKGILLGQLLAERLQVEVNDSIVLFSQGYHGVTAAGKYKILGLFKHANPVFNKQLVYLDLESARDFYNAEDRLTSLVIMVENNAQMNKLLPELKSSINSAYRVMSWEEMFPNLLQQIESDKSSAAVTKAILYMVIMFGILGTVMMMISERKREFGVMMAIGMSKYALMSMVVIETVLMAMLGVVAGFVGSMPVVGAFINNPIPLKGNGAEWMADLGFEPYMFFAWDVSVFVWQGIVVLVITLFVLIIPLIRILRMTEMKALKN